jgi:hypothetical protein
MVKFSQKGKLDHATRLAHGIQNPSLAIQCLSSEAGHAIVQV